jgi:hypothetical protein
MFGVDTLGRYQILQAHIDGLTLKNASSSADSYQYGLLSAVRLPASLTALTRENINDTLLMYAKPYGYFNECEGKGFSFLPP